MKKFAILLSLLIIFLSAKNVLADYQSIYQEYINKTGAYNTTYNNYTIARSSYLNSQSLESKDKALNATRSMLEARDSLIVSYLSAIKEKLKNNKGILESDKSSILGQLDTEIVWYNAHSSKLPSAGSLDDLVADSNEAKTQFNNSTLSIIYGSLVDLGVGDNTFIRGEIVSEVGTLNAKISEIKANQDKDVSLAERSIIDIQNKLTRSMDKDNAAKTAILGLKPTDQQKSNVFSNAMTLITDSNSYLKEATAGLLQVITQLKTAN